MPDTLPATGSFTDIAVSKNYENILEYLNNYQSKDMHISCVPRRQRDLWFARDPLAIFMTFTRVPTHPPHEYSLN